jgi:hypothetical protein
MTFAIVYVFIAVCTSIAVVKAPYDDSEIIASGLAGLVWPLLFTVRIISKIFS